MLKNLRTAGKIGLSLFYCISLYLKHIHITNFNKITVFKQLKKLENIKCKLDLCMQKASENDGTFVVGVQELLSPPLLSPNTSGSEQKK